MLQRADGCGSAATDADAERLHPVLTYRAAGLHRDEIRVLLDDPRSTS